MPSFQTPLLSTLPLGILLSSSLPSGAFESIVRLPLPSITGIAFSWTITSGLTSNQTDHPLLIFVFRRHLRHGDPLA